MLQTKNSNKWSCSFQEVKHVKKTLTDDAGRRSMAIAHLGDSGELKMAKILHFLSSLRTFEDISKKYDSRLVKDGTTTSLL